MSLPDGTLTMGEHDEARDRMQRAVMLIERWRAIRAKLPNPLRALADDTIADLEARRAEDEALWRRPFVEVNAIVSGAREHSPGPWEALRTVDGTEIQSRAKLIAFVECGDSEEANARLIAAAPALRALLDEAITMVEVRARDLEDDDTWRPDAVDLVARAKAALEAA